MNIKYEEIINLKLNQLSDLCGNIFDELKIIGEERSFLRKCIKDLAYHHTPSTEHSLRVTALSYIVGKSVYASENENYLKGLVYGACLHDIGKTKMPVKLLDKIDFDDNNKKEIEEHAIKGYCLLKKLEHDFSAEVILRVHDYPIIKPEIEIEFSDPTRNLIKEISRLIAINDSYDAMRTRKNKKYDLIKSRVLTRSEAFSALIKQFEKDKPFIENLYNKGIF